MKRKRAFTMIELMIAIVIVAILASVVAPVVRGRLDRAKWSEAMAGCSTIATAIRAWGAENTEATGEQSVSTIAGLGFQENDLNGKYFVDADYVLEGDGATYNPATNTYSYTIRVTPSQDNAPSSGELTLDQNGDFILKQDGAESKF